MVDASLALTVDSAAETILEARRRVAPARALLAAISGIDGSGKGYVAAEIARRLAPETAVATINIDGWLNLPDRRFDAWNPAEHFYEHAIRFDDLFEQLVLPLRGNRRIRLLADFAEETATQYRKYLYAFENVDVILLEGIYLLKKTLRPHYDVSCWIECSFETALERAIARGQEGLPPDETIAAYRTIYFPAQEIHLQRDAPRAAADAVLINDPRLAERRSAARAG